MSKKTKQNYISAFNTKKYTYKGKKNKTIFPEFISICKKTQAELKFDLVTKLTEAGYPEVICADGYVYAKGELPILLTAHLDTVHDNPVKDFYEFVDKNGSHILSSPQGIGGDDRCGVYMILEIIKNYKPSILFCEDEETGGQGSKKFTKTEFINDLSDLKYLIELDRANANDAVFYDCDNPEFTKFIEETTGFKKSFGSFSDISVLAPACKVAAVNLSCGYYHAHTLREEVNMEEMFNTISAVKKLLETESEQYEYIEKKYSYIDWGVYGRYGLVDYDDYGWGSYGGYSGSSGNYFEGELKEEYECVVMYVTFNRNEKEDYDEVYGYTKEECWADFFMGNPDICYNDVLDYYFDVF